MHIFDRFFNGDVYDPVFKWPSLGGAGRTRHFSGDCFLFSSLPACSPFRPRRQRDRCGAGFSRPPASQNVVDVMSKENRQQQNSDATNPEEKMLGQPWGIDLFLVHD